MRTLSTPAHFQPRTNPMAEPMHVAAPSTSGRTLRLRFPPCGWASLHCQPMPNTAAALPFMRLGPLGLASLSTHDEHCGCASLHFQPMTYTAAAPRFTFHP